MSSDRYKSQGIHSKEYRQSERRHALLEIQKNRRNELMDEHRSIEPLKRIFRKTHHKKHTRIKNQLMLSEWLKEVPDDIKKWYIKPCPKGTRVLVIAVDGTTRVFNKYGAFMKRFQSELQGDRRNRRDQITILDCVYVSATEEYFVLDVLAYGNQALTECDAEFRFFWIESQIRESNLDQVTDHNEYPFRIIEKYSCGDEMALNEILSKYPIWPNNQPELDGFLFYHGEASYMHGKTPLVGWLYAFMIPELFDVPYFNHNYLMEKPADYFDCHTFMKQFDENLENKRKNRRNKYVERMDEESGAEKESDENGAVSIVREVMELEKGGIDDDELNDFDTIKETTSPLSKTNYL